MAPREKRNAALRDVRAGQTTSDLLQVNFLFRFQKGAKSTLLFADSDKLLNIRIFLIGKMF